METRLKLHSQLVDILGSNNVYFQPGPNVKLTYPCIVYELSNGDTQFADNKSFAYYDRYQIKIIGRDPDSDIRLKVKELPMCLFDRRYIADNLYHDIFNIYV